MQIFIKHIVGKFTTIDAELNDTIYDIKAKIEDKWNILIDY
jgi:hypothetical protein